MEESPLRTITRSRQYEWNFLVRVTNINMTGYFGVKRYSTVPNPLPTGDEETSDTIRRQLKNRLPSPDLRKKYCQSHNTCCTSD
ncbi:hypothetical protein PROFUN_05405 [Planoprotostelium fungivorum]|uniref:Uncharacterized protein n=1 Tax=Planoprotostelium fungivorum TaxID=1890364 RepID=A0A2P6NQQ5_9EUKA|nr:hypothetical protein PROFUN_05405 [Planoprotostelium fungivorum]